ncbi:MAG: hypothetical protein HZB16_16605 [Armatimonadetes bacterium]|nr:hypothetical protein [Armatimonadota bacterium]
MRTQQQVRFPAEGQPYLLMDLAASFTWLATLAGGWAVYRQCWAEAREGSQLLLGAYRSRPGSEEAWLTWTWCGIALFMWLSAKVKSAPPGRHERFVLAAWWPALVLGLSLVFWVGPLSRRATEHALAVLTTETQAMTTVLRGNGAAPSEGDLGNLARRVTQALPGVYAAATFRYERPARRLRYANALHFELDPDGRVLRVRRDDRLDDEATERHRGRREADIIAQLGPPMARDAYFPGPWRMVFSADAWWSGALVYRPGVGWRAGDSPCLSANPESMWRLWYRE